MFWETELPAGADGPAPRGPHRQPSPAGGPRKSPPRHGRASCFAGAQPRVTGGRKERAQPRPELLLPREHTGLEPSSTTLPGHAGPGQALPLAKRVFAWSNAPSDRDASALSPQRPARERRGAACPLRGPLSPRTRLGTPKTPLTPVPLTSRCCGTVECARSNARAVTPRRSTARLRTLSAGSVVHGTVRFEVPAGCPGVLLCQRPRKGTCPRRQHVAPRSNEAALPAAPALPSRARH